LFSNLVSLPCPFSGKRGEKEGFPNKNGIWREGHDTNKKYLFKKWLTKKNLFEGRATTQTKSIFSKNGW